jgi:tetratricopeptide (TPR) repeat protein
MKKKVSFFLFLVLLCNSALLLAQAEPESIVPETDKFQDFFYESLKQKGIENYDRAITALEECLKLQPNDAAVYAEMGRNYFGLKNNEQSYSSFEKAAQIEPKNRWYWLGMYDASYQSKNYKQAIIAVNKLIEFDQKYLEDLVSLYMYTEQFEQALDLINNLNEKIGKSDRRDIYKSQILAQGKFLNTEINNLLTQIKLNPKEERYYIALIKLYSESNEFQKTAEIIKKLEIAIPSSDWAQVGLFKTHLTKNDAPSAIKAVNVVLVNKDIALKIKYQLLNDLLIYVNKNPQYSVDLEKIIGYFDNDVTINSTEEIGKFYYQNKKWDKAIYYLEQALKNNLNIDVQTSVMLLQSYVETKQFEIAVKKAMIFLETYPTQPQFYYFAGLSYNQLKRFSNAKIILEMGMDYLVDDTKLEINLYNQLGQAYDGLGNLNKKELYLAKANQLLKAKK